MNQTYTFAILGCGMIAGIHAAAITAMPGAILAGAYDAVEERSIALAKKYGCFAYPTQQALLEDKDVDIVCICTPSGLHASAAIAAANAGKHVIVEKPMALNLADADAVIEAGRRNGVQICVISQLRFSPAVDTLRNVLSSGGLGKMVLGNLHMKYHRSAEYYNSGGWRGTWEMDGGGALINQGIHGVDLLCYICGPVTAVTAKVKTLVHSIEVEDTVCALLEFENGALGTLEATTAIKPGYSRQLEVCGSDGSVVLEEDAVLRWDLPADYPMPQKNDAVCGSANDPTAISYTGHLRQFENLIKAIRGEVPLLVDAAQGRIPLALILAIYESAKTGCTVRLNT